MSRDVSKAVASVAIKNTYARFVQLGVLEFAQKWVLPAALAVVMFGQLAFSMLQFRFGVSHPAWPVWGVVALLTGVFAWRVLPRMSWRDAAFALLLLAIVVAFFRGHAPAGEFASQLITSIALPYVAARSIRAEDQWRFLFCVVIVSVSVMIIAITEIISLPPEMLGDDRVLLFFDRLKNGAGGVASQPYVAASMGVLIVVSAVVLLCARATLKLWVPLGVVGLFLASWLLVFAGTRAVMLAALLIVVSNILWIKRQHGPLRFAVLILVLGGAVSAVSVASSARVGFLADAIRPNIGAASGLAETLEVSGNCLPKGVTSVELRIYLVEQAWEQFVENPLLGVGLGNFGPSCETKYIPFDSPHNILLHVVVEAGFVAGLILTALIVSPFTLLRGGHTNIVPMSLLSIFALFTSWELMSGSIFNDGQFYAALGLVVTACRDAVGARRQDELPKFLAGG